MPGWLSANVCWLKVSVCWLTAIAGWMARPWRASPILELYEREHDLLQRLNSLDG